MNDKIQQTIEAIKALPDGAYLQSGMHYDLRNGSNLKALVTELERYREALDILFDGWKESWDCSGDPGHEIMEREVLNAQAAFNEQEAGE